VKNEDGFWKKPRTDGQCEVIVNRGDHRVSIFQPCGRPAKADGLCSFHISVRARRDKGAKADRKKRQRDEEIKAEGAKLAKRIGGGDVYYNSSGPASTWHYERKLIVSFDVLKALLP
jgi:hypothetical protein